MSLEVVSGPPIPEVHASVVCAGNEDAVCVDRDRVQDSVVTLRGKCYGKDEGRRNRELLGASKEGKRKKELMGNVLGFEESYESNGD